MPARLIPPTPVRAHTEVKGVLQRRNEAPAQHRGHKDKQAQVLTERGPVGVALLVPPHIACITAPLGEGLDVDAVGAPDRETLELHHPSLLGLEHALQAGAASPVRGRLQPAADLAPRARPGIRLQHLLEVELVRLHPRLHAHLPRTALRKLLVELQELRPTVGGEAGPLAGAGFELPLSAAGEGGGSARVCGVRCLARLEVGDAPLQRRHLQPELGLVGSQPLDLRLEHLRLFFGFDLRLFRSGHPVQELLPLAVELFPEPANRVQ
mmetsp:Transcript_15083/g.45177  ORF Transcript_15083/g.45177 Transcript_15083/m.45177 type:complete len:267 (-) Transcript_15083:126-926(-)